MAEAMNGKNSTSYRIEGLVGEENYEFRRRDGNSAMGGGGMAGGGLVEYVRTELFPKIRFEMERRICWGM